MTPVFLHLDMNSYFASVQQQDNLAWRGKPLGVCEHLGGIIISASIEAKKWGIKTGTPVWEARRLYPKIILTKTAPDRYRFYTTRFVKVVSDYTDLVEKYSIDEVFLDITKACNIKVPRLLCHSERAGLSKDSREPRNPLNFTNRLGLGDPSTPRQFQNKEIASSARFACEASRVGMTEYVDPWEEAVKIAETIKARMKREVGDYLTCSIGIGENKLVAKIASDLKKPDGIILVKSEKLKVESENKNVLILCKDDLYTRLSLTDIPGIGRRQEKRLNELGIRTLLDLKNYPYSRLVSNFGILGHHLYFMGQLKGSWKPAVKEEEEIKSIGHMYTLPESFREKKFFVPVLYKLCEMVARRMRQQNLMGNILHFYLRGKNYEGYGYGESKKLGYYIFDGREIFYESIKIFECSGVTRRSEIEFKLIGVTIAGLHPNTNQQSLFESDERLKRVVCSLDKINEKYGDFTVCRVPVLGAKEAFHDSIGFGRLKEFSKWKRK